MNKGLLLFLVVFALAMFFQFSPGREGAVSVQVAAAAQTVQSSCDVTGHPGAVWQGHTEISPAEAIQPVTTHETKNRKQCVVGTREWIGHTEIPFKSCS
jgi:hypothetical protein